MTTRPSSWESPPDDPEDRYLSDPPSDAIHECQYCDGHGGHVIECTDCWSDTNGDGPDFCDQCVWGYRYYECEECDGKGHTVEDFDDYVDRKRDD